MKASRSGRAEVIDGYLYQEPIDRIHRVLGAIFVLASVLWLPTIYLFDSALR